MNKVQNSKLSMYSVMVLFFTKYSTVFTTFTTLVSEISAFLTSKGQLDVAITQQATVNTGVTADKNSLVVVAIEILVKFARKARVWASNTNNQTLEHLFDVRKSDYTIMHEAEALDALITVRNSINTNILALATYNVLPANVVTIDKAISNAQASIGSPKVATNIRITNTAEIVDILKTADEHLDNIDDLLVSEYEGTTTVNTQMVAAYLLGRNLGPLGHNHTGIHTLCKDSITGELLEGVLMEIVELNKSTHSTILGVAEIIQFKTGTYHITFTLGGYITYSIILTIPRGKIIDMQALLVKKAAA